LSELGGVVLDETPSGLGADGSMMGGVRYKWKLMFSIEIISDMHGLLRPEAERRLTGVDHIVHAGDIGRPEIVDALRRIAPVTTIRGNVDTGEWARQFADTELVRLAGKSIYVLHDLKTLQLDARNVIDVVVFGHSHLPKIQEIDGILYLNPGSAGPRRFKPPISLATLEVRPEGLRPEIHDLETAAWKRAGEGAAAAEEHSE
jgi:putative phosphoesterase